MATKKEKNKYKKGATGKTYTTYGDRIKVTYTDGSSRIVRPSDSSYNVTKKAMDSDIASKKHLFSGSSKATATNAIGEGVTDGRGLVVPSSVEKKQEERHKKNKQQKAYKELVEKNKATTKKTIKSVEKGVKSGFEQGVNNLVQGTKQGALAMLDSPLVKAASKASAPQPLALNKTARKAQAFNQKIAGNYSLEQQRRNLATQTAKKQQAITNKYGKLNPVEQTVSDVTANVVPMVPMMGASLLSGGLASILGAGTKGVQAASAIGSMAPMFNYSRGLGEQQALNEGASLSKANKYGFGSGALETGTELMFAGIPFLPGVFPGAVKAVKAAGKVAENTAGKAAGKVAEKTAEKVVENAVRPSLRTLLLRSGADLAGEGVEEAVSTAADPFLQRATYNQNAQNASAKDMAASFGLGALTAGVLKSGVAAPRMIPKLARASTKLVNSAQNTPNITQNQEQAVQDQVKNAQNPAENAQDTQNAVQQPIINQPINNINAPQNTVQNQNNVADNIPTQEQIGNKGKESTVSPRQTLDMSQRDFKNVGSKKVKAYQQENPSAKPYIQDMASTLLGDLQQGIKGGREYGINPETRTVNRVDRIEREQSQPINAMLDKGMTYKQIEDGLQRLVDDNGRENTASAKRAELYVYDALQNGYQSIVSGDTPANVEFQYNNMSVEELQGEMNRLENSFLPENTDEENRSIIDQLEAATNVLQRKQQQQEQVQQNDISPKLSKPEVQDTIERYADYEESKIPTDVSNFLRQASQRSKTNIEVRDGLPKGGNGMYVNGTIYLDGNKLNSMETARKLVAHEMYHNLKGTDEFLDIQDLAKSYLLSKNPDTTMNDILNEKIEEYGKKGVELDSDGAWDEVTANFMEEVLSNKKLARKVWEEKPTVAQRILDALNNILEWFKDRKLTEAERKQKSYVQRAAKEFSDGLYALQYQKNENNANNERYNLDNESRIDELNKQYGSIQPGENPTGDNRDINVPKQTNDSNKVRQFSRTAMEAQQVGDRTAKGIQNSLESDIQSGKFTYEPTSNKADLAKANERIDVNGWEETGDQLHNQVKSGQRISSSDVATLERLVQEAQKAGKYDKAVDYISDLAIIGTESGQNIQALRLLKRLSPEGQLMALKNTERRINNALVSQGKSKLPEISDETAQEFLEARGNKLRNEIWDKEIVRMARETEGSWQEKIDAIRYASMLSNPRTHIRNLVGNIAMQAAITPKNMISKTLQDANALTKKKLSPVGTKTEQTQSWKNRTGQSTKELREYAEYNWKEAGEQAMRGIGNRYDDATGTFNQNRRTFGHTKAGNVLEALAGNTGKRSVGNVLGAEDMLFKKVTYINALVDYMKANGITTQEAMDQMNYGNSTNNALFGKTKESGASIAKGMEYASREAQKATFTEDNKVAKLFNKAENLNKGTKVIVGSVLPFKKTPANILTRGVEYSPVGILMTGYKLQDVARKQKTNKYWDSENKRYVKEKVERESEYTLNDVFDSLAANITGTGLLALGMGLASYGFLRTTGDDDDKRKEDYDSQMGMQNYAITFPDGGSYTIDWLAPSVMPVLTGVEIYKQMFGENKDEDASRFDLALNAAGRISDPVFETSMLQGVSSALASYSGDSGDIASTIATNMVSSYGGQFIPQPVAALARTVDDTSRSSYAPKKYQKEDGSTILPKNAYFKQVEKFLRQQSNKLPVASENSQPSIDAWGNERKREFSGNNASDYLKRAFANFVSPGTYSSDKKTKLDNSLTELYEKTGESGVLPKKAESYIKLKDTPTVYLSPLEYSKASTTQGKKSHEYVSDFVESSMYGSMDDSDKADVVSKLYSLAKYQAKKEALKGRGISYSDEAYENALDSGVAPYKYYATAQKFGGDYKFETAQKYAEYADKMGISYDKFSSVGKTVSSFRSDKNAKGKSIKGSTEKKVVNYLNEQLSQGNITEEQWYYFYTKKYPSKAKYVPKKYAWIREANKKTS